MPIRPEYDPAALQRELRELDLALSRLVRLSLKRALDVLVAAAALIVLSPLLVVIAALIKQTDGGPVFFGQVRVGLRGRTFQMLKFRSMVVHAERLRPRLEVRNESNGPVFKMRLDPRVTPIGRFIRRYSLDELPQLFNILMGDMSIVGPRPSLPSEVARYEPWQYRRFAVRPGLTCFWQVSPTRYQISFDDWMRLDLKYVEGWSLRLDAGLILRTFRVVLAGTGQ
ncbi:MAG TPA: sugar transferase [Myxococcales bacterium]|nr:sugar transferase [Myxococcales bacterium]